MLVRLAIVFLLGAKGAVSAQQIQLQAQQSGKVTVEMSGKIWMKIGGLALQFANATFSFDATNGVVIGKGQGSCLVRSNEFELNASSVEFDLREDEIRLQGADAMTLILKWRSRSDITLVGDVSIKLESEHLSYSSSNARLEFSSGGLKITDAATSSVRAELGGPALPTTGVAPPNDGSWGIETAPTAGVRVR